MASLLVPGVLYEPVGKLYAAYQGALDAYYEITKEDKRAVLLVLGAKTTVWPSEGYPERVRFEISPPDIQRFCDFFFQ